MTDHDPAATATSPDQLRWVRRGVFLAILAIGWLFIFWQNRFYLNAPVVFVCLGFLAVLAAIYTLWRTGVVAVADEAPGDDSTWLRPLGARGELEHEKRTLLKAIKEAEFDRDMGKLSKADADAMIAMYRARAIETIKELDKLAAGAAGSVREQIDRELKARLEIDAKTGKGAGGDAARDKRADKQANKQANNQRAAEAAPAADPAAAASADDAQPSDRAGAPIADADADASAKEATP